MFKWEDEEKKRQKESFEASKKRKEGERTAFQPAPSYGPTKVRSATEVSADIYRLGKTNKEAADQLNAMFEAEQDNKSSIYYNPYRKSTNSFAIQGLMDAGVDLSGGINDDFFSNYAWLKEHQRTGAAGTPLAPTKKSSQEEAASYYYDKLLNAEETTRKAEAEWADLQQKAAYWAGRGDRNYSDDEIIKLLDIEKNYPTLARMESERKSGTPVQLNRAVGYNQESIKGAIWAGRNGGSTGDSYADAVLYKMGEGRAHMPNPTIRRRLNPASTEYNPYLIGSTIDDDAALFGMQSFTRDWVDQMAGEVMANGTEARQKAFQRIFTAEEFTRKAEDTIKDFKKRPEAHIRAITAAMRREDLNADDAIAQYMAADYKEIGKLIDGINRRNASGTTRALNFDYHAFKQQVEDAYQAAQARQSDPAEAAKLEREAMTETTGTTVEDDLNPQSNTNTPGFWGTVFEGINTFLDPVGTGFRNLFGIKTKEEEEAEEAPAGASLPEGGRLWASASVSDAPVGRISASDQITKWEADLERVRKMRDEELEKYGQTDRWKSLYQTVNDIQAAIAEKQKEADEESSPSIAEAIESISAKKEELDSMMSLTATKPRDIETFDDIDVPEGYQSDNDSFLNKFRKIVKEQEYTGYDDLLARRGALLDDLVERKGAMTVTRMSLGLGDEEEKAFSEKYSEFIRTEDDEKIIKYLAMTDEEVSKYNYIYDTLGKKEAENYYRSLEKTTLKGVYADTQTKRMEDFAEKNPVLMTIVGNTSLYLGSVYEGYEATFNKVFFSDRLLDADLAYTRALAAVNQQVSKDFNNTEQFWFDFATNALQQTTRIAMGNKVSLLYMGGSMSATYMQKGQDEGWSESETAVMASLATGIEMIIESVDVNRYFKFAKGLGSQSARGMVRGILGNVFESAFAEGLEEILGGLATDLIAENLVFGKNSSMHKRHAELMEDGLSEDEAWGAYAVEFLKSLGMEGLQGAVSGAFFGGISSISGQFQSRQASIDAEDTYKHLQGMDLTTEEAQQGLVQLAAQVVVSYDTADMKPGKNFEKLSSYEKFVAQGLSIDEATAKSIADDISRKGGVEQDTSIFSAIRVLAEKEDKPRLKVIKSITGTGLNLDQAQTLAKLNMLTEAIVGQDSAKYSPRIAAEIDTALMTATEAAAKSAGIGIESLQYAQNRWGRPGILYIGELIKNGTQDALTVAKNLQAMPSFAQSVIVAEENMKTFGMTDEKIRKQLEAFAADGRDVAVTEDTKARTVNQTVETAAQKALAANPDTAIAERKAFEKANVKLEEARASLDKANSEMESTKAALQEAYERFQATPEDNSVADHYKKMLKTWKEVWNKVEAEQENFDRVTATRNETQQALNQKLADLKQAARQQATEQVAQQTEVQAEQTEVQTAEALPPNFEADADAFIDQHFADRSEEEKAEARQKFLNRINEKLGRKVYEPAEAINSERNQDFMSKVEKKFGIKFKFDDSLPANVEGQLIREDGTIVINPNVVAGDALIGVAMHELTHIAEESGWYNMYQESVLGMKYGENYTDSAAFERAVDDKIKRYKNAGIDLSVDQAIREMVAEESRNTIFADEASIRNFVDREPSVARRILDALTEMIRKLAGIGDTEAAELQRAQVLLETALNDRADRLSPDRVDQTADRTQGATVGTESHTFTADNQRIDFKWGVIDKSELITSNNDDFTVNEGYPQELQPKDRTRGANIQQVEEIERDLNPERLGAAPEVTSGAPVIGKDLVVEAGNGRAIALRRALTARNEFAMQYVQWLKNNAAEFGIDPGIITDDSVLVRIRDTEVNRERFAMDGNVQPGVNYSPSEHAASDARKLTPEMLSKVKVSSTGDLDLSANNSFITWFINNVIPVSERNSITTEDNWLSKTGFDRLRNTLFQRAFGDINVTAQLSEQTDGVIKNAINAMTAIAPKLAIVNDMTAEGALVPNRIAQNILDAYKGLQTIRTSGLDVDVYLSQVSMDGTTPSFDAATEAIIRLFDDNKNSRKRIKESFDTILNLLAEQGDPRQTQNFETTPLTNNEIVQQGIRQYAEMRDGKQESMFDAASVAYSIVDDNYMAAVKQNDTDTAQRLVDEAARAAGYTLQGYHGTSQQTRSYAHMGLAEETDYANKRLPFTIFKPGNSGGIYIASSRAYADAISGRADGKPGTTMGVYTRFANPLVIDEHVKTSVPFYDSIPTPSVMKEAGYTQATVSTEEISLFAQGAGYDGVIIEGIREGGGIFTNDYIAFTAEQIKSADLVTYDDSGKVIPLSERFNPESVDIRYSLTPEIDNLIDAEIERLLQKYGAIPQGEKAKNTAPIPAQTTEDTKVRKFARTVSEADILDERASEEFRQKLVDGEFSYEPISDKSALEYSEGVAKGGVKALETVWNRAIAGDKIPSKKQVAVGEKLLTMYAEAGDATNALRLTGELAEVLTRAGQTVQAARLLKKTTNAGQLQYLQGAVQKLNEGIKGKQIEIDPALVEQLLNAKTDQERDEAVRAIQKNAGKQIRPNWKTRLNAWRYFAMLGNPRTHMRNILGNAIFMPAIKMKNMMAATIEAVAGTERTKSAFISRSEYQAALKDSEAHLHELQGGGKYNPQGEIEQYKRSFGDSPFDKLAEGLTQFNTNMLELEDVFFLKRHYANALAGYLKAKGLTLDTADAQTLAVARQYAVDEAKKGTYRDASQLATSLNKMSKEGGLKGLIIEGIIPFKKTPVNIVKRGFEYSPFGLIESLTRGTVQLKQGKINATQFIDKISSGLTGTALAALGLWLGNIGAIRVRGGDDKKEAFEEQMGAQNYSVEIFGHSISLDWMTPVSMPLFIGATLNKKIEEEQSDLGPFEALNVGWQALQGLLEPIYNLSMLDGVSRAFNSAVYNQENPLTGVAVTSATNYAGQYVPTLFGQIARTIDDTRRTTYVDKNIPVDSNIQRFVGGVANKLPVVSLGSIPYTDVWGNPQGKDSWLLRGIENFFSPAYLNELNPDTVESALIELYDLTKDSSILPTEAGKYFSVNGETVNMTAKEYTEYRADRGAKMHGTLEKLFDDPRYQVLDFNGKAKLVKDVYDYATQSAKVAMRKDYNIDKWAANVDKAANPIDALMDRYESKELDAARTEYREEAIKAATTGDDESLSVTVEALIQSKLAEGDDITYKKASSYAKTTLQTRVKNAYLAAYDEGDEAMMEQIEDTFAMAGILYNYRDWLKGLD